MSVIVKKIDTDVPKNVRLYGTDTAGGVVPMLTDLSGQLSIEVSVADSLVAKISGETVIAKTASLGTAVSGNVFSVGTSGTQFPAVAGRVFNLALMTSNVIYIAGAATVNSGTGYILAGDPNTSIQAYYKFEGTNLNLLYGKAMDVSGSICFLALT
jgi:hypothetical protein